VNPGRENLTAETREAAKAAQRRWIRVHPRVSAAERSGSIFCGDIRSSGSSYFSCKDRLVLGARTSHAHWARCPRPTANPCAKI